LSGALRRAFLAVVPPPPVLDAVAGLVEAATRRGFRWTRRDQWHVTIQYFGRVDDSDALIGALAGSLVTVAAAPVQLRGAGAFPSERRASVYWLGVADPAPLAAVHAAVMRAAGTFVRPRDRIVYVPHLTLARLSSPKKLTEDVEALRNLTFGPPWTAEELTLFESETRRDGAVYREVARLPLG
jgi:2'-5' RNA ligase